MAKANTRRSRKSKNTNSLEMAFEALKGLPAMEENRPENCFTRKELAEAKFNGSRTRAVNAIGKLLKAGRIKAHEQLGVGGAKYYYYVG